MKIPIACTLTADDVPARVEAWRAVVGAAVGRTEIDGGVRLDFGADGPVVELARLAAAEQSCCAFFSFAVTVDARGVGLEVRAPEDGRQVLDALFG